MTKWLSGIAATILGGVILWWLTHQGGPLNPTPRPSEPALNVKLTAFDPGSPFVGEGSTGHFTIYNEGDITGQDCKVYWYSGTEVAEELASGKLPQKASVSDPFGLKPKESRELTMQSLVYTGPGQFETEADVSCLGVNHPLALRRTINVRPR